MRGKVIEVFIPDDNFNKIGFKIQLDDEVVVIIQEQDKFNCKIYRDDEVVVSYDNDVTIIEKVEYAK